MQEFINKTGVTEQQDKEEKKKMGDKMEIKKGKERKETGQQEQVDPTIGSSNGPRRELTESEQNMAGTTRSAVRRRRQTAAEEEEDDVAAEEEEDLEDDVVENDDEDDVVEEEKDEDIVKEEVEEEKRNEEDNKMTKNQKVENDTKIMAKEEDENKRTIGTMKEYLNMRKKRKEEFMSIHKPLEKELEDTEEFYLTYRGPLNINASHGFPLLRSLKIDGTDLCMLGLKFGVGSMPRLEELGIMFKAYGFDLTS